MIEIKELVVRAIILTGAPQRERDGEIDAGEAGHQNPLNEGASDAMIEDCVRQVLAILERQKDR
jgi:Family of unknown function (DUF5908)